MSVSQTPAPQGVSVITPVYNEGEWLETTVPSILALPADEWIWVDDGSTDDSPALLSSLIEREPRARLIRLGTNRGRAFARNAAIARATQPLLAFIDADVKPYSRFLEFQLNELKKNPETIASVGRGVFVNPNTNDPYQRYLATGRRGPRNFRGGPVPWRYFISQGSLVRRDRVIDVGGFPEEVEYGEDTALASRLRRNDPNGLVYSPDATFEMLGPSSLTGISEKLELFGRGLALLSAEDPTILSWTRLASIERPMSGALLRSERIALFARSLTKQTGGLFERLLVRYLLAHATAIGFHSSPRTS